ncbi:MAG: glutathione S-transferase family protein [Pseudomonadota bacterium]
MLTLITFKPGLGLRSPSPFAIKADALMTMSGLSFTRDYGDVVKAPRKKLPVLKDGERLIPDSSHIQRHLETEHGIDFDGHLTEQERGVATAFQRLAEEHLYFIAAFYRWNDHAEAVKSTYFESVPGLLRGLVFGSVKKQLDKCLHLQGLGRHSRDELARFAKEDIDAIAHQLEDKTWFLGERLSSIDASIAAALDNNLNCTLETPITEMIRAHPNLVSYCARFKGEVFGEA